MPGTGLESAKMSNLVKMAIVEVVAVEGEIVSGIYFPDEWDDYWTQTEEKDLKWSPNWSEGQTWADYPQRQYEDHYDQYDENGVYLS